MSMIHRARVCAIGAEADIRRLLTRMLDNYGYWDPDEERPRLSLQELKTLVEQVSAEDGGAGDTFLYEMICVSPYGDAVPTTCRLSLQPGPGGLWLAVFAYDSDHRFQPHDWKDLHHRCSNLLMLAQRASEDFTLEKGEVLFAGDQVQEIWDNMEECWLWLMQEYGAGSPTEDALEQMELLQQVMQEEDYDMDIPTLLDGCVSNLEGIAEDNADPEALGAALQEALAGRDFARALNLLCTVAESALWETQHNARWLACLNALREAWARKYPEGG